MAVGTRTSRERAGAIATYPADLQTIGDHMSGTVTSPSMWLAKPRTGTEEEATHILLQATGQTDIRYRIDTGEATPTTGFQLVAGLEVSLIPVPNTGISLSPESPGATYEAQWVR